MKKVEIEIPDGNEDKWHFQIYKNDKIRIDYIKGTTTGGVYFKSEELARKAIEICGLDIIKEALMV